MDFVDTRGHGDQAIQTEIRWQAAKKTSGEAQGGGKVGRILMWVLLLEGLGFSDDEVWYARILRTINEHFEKWVQYHYCIVYDIRKHLFWKKSKV